LPVVQLLQAPPAVQPHWQTLVKLAEQMGETLSPEAFAQLAGPD